MPDAQREDPEPIYEPWPLSSVVWDRVDQFDLGVVEGTRAVPRAPPGGATIFQTRPDEGYKLPRVRQRVELTYKQNRQHGRHGWLRLTPAYSVRLVEQVLAEFGEGAQSVFEPFSGTGTTPLCAAYRGLRAHATDINPFLIWFGRMKGGTYTEAQQERFVRAGRRIARRLESGKAEAMEAPPLKNIERWWGEAELEFVTALRGEVERERDEVVRDLLKVVFCRTMIGLSNAAFNHQSMSFKAPSPKKRSRSAETRVFVERFLLDVRTVADSVVDNPAGEIQIEHSDARRAAKREERGRKFDLLITSPPYPNRISYVRELRPYMYWLGFLEDGRQAGELDWEAIGGTWGVATSRLLAWRPTNGFVPNYLFPTLDRIRTAHPKNGELMARYVHKYFEDMFAHFLAAKRLVRRGGTAHYIVGNSTFYGHLIPAERLYCDQLLKAGFKRAEFRALRKRNSKKELIEFHVIAER